MKSSRCRLALFALATMAWSPSCSSQPNENTNAPIRIVPPSEIEAKRAADKLRSAQFQKALDTSQEYSSPIRSELINNPFDHRTSYRAGSSEFQNLPHQFRCPHDPSKINRISAGGWEIVKCELGEVTFFRRHAEANDEARRCFERVGVRMKDIGDEFETMTVSFPTFAPPAARVSDEESMIRLMLGVSFYSPGQPVEKHALQKLQPFGKFSRGAFYHDSGIYFDRYYAVDEPRKRLVQFDVGKSAGCKRNPKGWAKIDKHMISLDSPQSSIEDMDKALTDVITLFKNKQTLTEKAR